MAYFLFHKYPVPRTPLTCSSVDKPSMAVACHLNDSSRALMFKFVKLKSYSYKGGNSVMNFSKKYIKALYGKLEKSANG